MLQVSQSQFWRLVTMLCSEAVSGFINLWNTYSYLWAMSPIRSPPEVTAAEVASSWLQKNSEMMFYIVLLGIMYNIFVYIHVCVCMCIYEMKTVLGFRIYPVMEGSCQLWFIKCLWIALWADLIPDRVYGLQYYTVCYKAYTTNGDLTCCTTATSSGCNPPLGFPLALLH